jgi:hypothetical protein
MLESKSAIHSAHSWDQRSWYCSTQHWQPALNDTVKFGNDAVLGSEAVRLGNELGAALGACSLFTISDSLGKEQREQLSDQVRTDAGVDLGSDLAPALAQTTEVALLKSTRKNSAERSNSHGCWRRCRSQACRPTQRRAGSSAIANARNRHF